MTSRVVILGTADWNQPIATNQHYIARELSKKFDVVFVESMGLRRPEFSWRDAKRAWERVRGLLRRRSERGRYAGRDRGDVRVIAPLVIPLHGRFAAWLNFLLVRRLEASTGLIERRDTILWTFTPVTYAIEKRTAATIYHCVDLLGEVEGISAKVIDRNEKKLARSAAASIATSAPVEAHLRANGFKPMLWPNVADVDLIEAARPQEDARVPGRAIFAGNLSERKVDFDLLLLLLRSGVEVHLAGPISEGGGSSREHVDSLVHNGAQYHGVLSLPELARLYWTATCGLVPYKSNAYTEGVSPLKTYEYLAAELPVVSIGVPSVEPIVDHVRVCTDATSFVEAARSMAVLAGPAARFERSSIASGHSWVRRGAQARELVSELRSRVSDNER